MDNPNFRIMVVDDDYISREIVRHCLVHAGFHVAVAPGGRECLEGFAAAKWDLLILDFYMEDLNGLEVLKVLRADYHYRGPVIMYTSSSDKENVGQIIAAGVEGYLLKPVNPQRLLEAINRLLAGKTS